VKFKFVVQAPAAQATVAVASPVMTTFRPFSVQVPETVKDATFALLMYDAAAGEVIATTGLAVSLLKLRAFGVAGFPAASE
jgi:hypothetical protein